MLPLQQRQAILALFGEKQFQFSDGLSLPFPFTRNKERSEKADGFAVFYECRLGSFLSQNQITAFNDTVKTAGIVNGLRNITGTTTADMTLSLVLNFYAGVHQDGRSDTWIAANYFLNPPDYNPYDMRSESVLLSKISDFTGHPIVLSNSIDAVCRLSNGCTETLVRKKDSFFQDAIEPYFIESGLLSGFSSIKTVEKRLLLPFCHMFETQIY